MTAVNQTGAMWNRLQDKEFVFMGICVYGPICRMQMFFIRFIDVISNF